MRQTISERIAVGRFWLTAALCLASVAIGSMSLIIPGLDPVSSGIVWPLVTLAATLAASVLWLLGQSWPARIPLFVSGVIVGLFVIIPAHPEINGAGRISESTSEVTSALTAQDAPTWNQGVLFVLLTVAFLCSCGRTRSPPPRVGTTDSRAPARLGARTGIVAAVVLALVLGGAIPAGFGLRSLNQKAMRARAETITHYDPPETDHVDTDVKIGKQHGWSRTGLDKALPAGKITIGVRANTVVGLRSRDGAKLWQYQVKHNKDRDWISNVVVDTESRTVLVQVRDALIGIGFDGKTRYHTQLPHTGRWTVRWNILPTSQGSSSAPTLSHGETAVFIRKGNTPVSGHGPAKGFSVATGHRLWQTDTDESCDVVASTRGKTTHVLVTGNPPCSTRLLRFDGGQQRYETKLQPPKRLGSPANVESHSSGDPPLRTVDDDIVVVRARWFDEGNKKAAHTTALVDSTGAILQSRNQSLPGRLHPLDSKGHRIRLGTLDTGREERRPAWIVFDQKLHRQSVDSRTRLPKPPNRPWKHKVRRLGDRLDLVAHGKHHIRRLDKDLTRVETIDATHLKRCRKHGKMSITGDNKHLALSCSEDGKRITYVRPVS